MNCSHLIIFSLSSLAILVWWFHTSLPGMVSALLMPRSWFGMSRKDMFTKNSNACLDAWAMSPGMPMLLLKLLTCPWCMLAHVQLWVIVGISAVTDIPDIGRTTLTMWLPCCGLSAILYKLFSNYGK